jgi:hypothetical protein
VFSSDGPRRMFFAADGSAAPQTRQKPDVTAADGVRTSVADFDPFYGTSAAAPHAAAIAALIKSGNPRATTATVRQAFRATALDLAPAGIDARAGYGLLRADRILRFTGATPQPLVTAGAARVVSTTDGDDTVEPGETAQIEVPATNVGDNLATSVSLRVTSSAPGVTVTPRTRTIGKIPVGVTKTGTFTIAIPADWPLGRSVDLSARVSFVGALSPTDGSIAVPVGKLGPGQTFTYDGPAVPIPDDDIVGASVAIPGVRRRQRGRAQRLHRWHGVHHRRGVRDSRDRPHLGLRSPGNADRSQRRRRDGVRQFRRAAATTCVRWSSLTGPHGHSPSATSVDAPYTGTWAPASPLLSADAGSADGTWTLTVTDDASGDTGSIRSVSLHLQGWVAD